MTAVTKTITDQVIAQVKSRPVLWDKKHEMYGNIQAMDYEWSKLSMLMKRDKEFLKKRWRRVRDVFRIEMKKFKAPENPTKPLMNYYTGIWHHFESMLFLKDSLTKRIPRLFFPEDDETFDTVINTDSANTSVSINTNIAATSINNDSVHEEASPEAYEEPEEEFENKPLYVNVDNSWVDDNRSEPKASCSEDQSEHGGVKRKAEDWGPVLDEDVNFAKSIVGYLRRLNPIKKLMVRNEIQSILLRELLCDKCRFTGQQKACQCE